jgi:hypothetical protein
MCKEGCKVKSHNPANEHQADDNLDDTDASDRYYQAERKKYKRK